MFNMLTLLAFSSITAQVPAPSIQERIVNGGFEERAADTAAPQGFELKGNARWGKAGYRDETASLGVVLNSQFDPTNPSPAGEVSQTIAVNPQDGGWVTFAFRGRAEDGFVVPENALWMEMEFLSDHGTKKVESARRLIYREIVQDRKDFAINGSDHKSGASVWRNYTFEELLPFKEVDAVKVTLHFEKGAGTVKGFSKFYIDDFSLTQSTASQTGKKAPKATTLPIAEFDEKQLAPLGGHWYYRLNLGEALAYPLKVNYANANRLLYKDDTYTAPFYGNMTAFLHPGQLNTAGQLVKEETFVPDNVAVTFAGDGMISVRALNVPNHPTAVFPDKIGTQGYNPNYIGAKARTYRLPIEPVRNPNAIAMDAKNTNYALNMGSIGFAINGVVFYNPFDAGMTDATGIMDRCCGHPSQDSRYHYHKYPICVNTPFVDKGERHSSVIGWAFDGFPLYGPYEEAGILARDDTKNPLNAFNAHYDKVRGWHYHVTPGKFPYLIGGFMGKQYVSGR